MGYARQKLGTEGSARGEQGGGWGCRLRCASSDEGRGACVRVRVGGGWARAMHRAGAHPRSGWAQRAQQLILGRKWGGANGAVNRSVQAMRRRSGVQGASRRNQPGWPASTRAA